MEVRVFTIRMSNKHLITDQNQVNDFLKSVQLKKSSTHFVEGKENMWSLLVYYEPYLDKIRPSETPVEIANFSDDQNHLVDALKQWRQLKADEIGVAPYLILTNKTMLNLVQSKPQTQEDLLKVHGIGEVKASLYGQELVRLLKLNHKK